jgi:hypothetical protein
VLGGFETTPIDHSDRLRTILLASDFADTAAVTHDPNNPGHNTTISDPVIGDQSGLSQAVERTEEGAATRVRKAFLKEKKAFHEGRRRVSPSRRSVSPP